MTAFVAPLLAGSQIDWMPLAGGIVLGLGAAIPIGPVNVEIARRALRYGFLAGAALGFGAVTVDVVYAVLSTFSFVKVLTAPTVLLPIALLGTLLLTYLGVQCLRAARRAWVVDPLVAATGLESPSPIDRNIGRSYVTGVLMTLLNPMTLGFWFLVVPSTTSAPAAGSDAGTSLPLLCVGVFLGTAAWVVFFSTLLSIAHRVTGRNHARRRKWLALADAVGGVALLGFAMLSAVGFWRRLEAVL